MFRRLPWYLGTGLISLVVILPLGYIVAGFFAEPTDNWRALTEIDPEGLLEMLPPELKEDMMPEHSLLTLRLRGTLIMLGGVLALSSLLGISLAWLLSAYRIPGSGLWSVLLSLPLAIPSYIMAASLRLLTDDRALALSVWFRENHGADAMQAFDAVWKYALAILTLSAAFFPYVFLAARSAFCTLSKDYLEASRVLGHSQARSMWKIALPLARPAIVAGMMLVALETLNEYGAMQIIGIQTLLTEIFKIRSGANDLNTAVRLAGCVMSVVFVLICVELLLRGRRKFHASRTGGLEHRGAECSALRKVIVVAICAVVFVLSFVVPVTGLVMECRHAAVMDYLGDTLGPAWDSLVLTLAASLLMLVAGLWLCLAQRRVPGWPIRVMTKVSTMGYAVPGAILGVAILSWSGAWLQQGMLSGVVQFVFYGSSLGLVLAYGIRFLTVAVHPLESGYAQISTSLDDASSMLRRGLVATVWRVHLPLLRPSVLAALLILAVDVMKELPLTLILSPFNTETLAMHTYGMFAVQEDYPRASVPALVLIGTCVACILTIRFILRSRKARI